MSSSFRKPRTIKRYAAGTYNKGIYTEGTENQFEITASVQPTTPSDINALPEGRRDSISFRIYTDADLRTSEGETPRTNPDKIVLYGQDYEVVKEMTWLNSVINHRKYVVAQVLES